jgi:DNA-directed RNA polymerase specialized sigma24 family protein
MSVLGSVSQLLKRLKAGEQSALGKLLDRFWPFLIMRAGRSLKKASRRYADEEDVAQIVAWDLYKGFEQGRWEQLANRQDLVALLTQITECRAVNQIKHELTKKRGAGCILGESALNGMVDSGKGIDRAVLDPHLAPEDQVLQDEWCRHCLDQLESNLRPYAELHLAGSTVKEIAMAMKCSERTVARKIALIRAKWLTMMAV